MFPWEADGGLGFGLRMSRILNKYIVTNFSMVVNSESFMLVIRLDRLSGPFWFSLFIPSICLILAAEVALFIDHSHFEAMIMVALTSNLVMYTLYSSVQAQLPEDSSLKLIDIWLLHGLLMPMIVFVTLAANELINSKIDFKNTHTKIANSAVKYFRQWDQEQQKRNKSQLCMDIWKAIIPITSLVFVITYFIICFKN